MKDAQTTGQIAGKTERRLIEHLSPMAIWAIALGSSIGWGSLVVTSNTYLVQAGPAGSVLGIVIGGLIMLIISKNYAYMINCFPEAGGVYTYAKEAFGYDHGFLAGWFLMMTYLAILWANATSLPLFAKYFIGNVFHVGKMYTLFGYEVCLGEALLSIAALALVGLFCAHSRKAVSGAMTVMAVIFAVGITVVFIGSLAGHSISFHPAYIPDKRAFSQIFTIAVISPWAFIGFESVSNRAEEFAFKRSKIFKILIVAVIATTLLYVFVTLLSASAYPERYGSWMEYMQDLNNLNGIEGLPAFYAAQHYMGGAGITLLMISLLALIVTSLIGMITALSRLLYAMGKDRVFPVVFAKLNSKNLPSRAVLLIVLVSFIMPFLGRTAIGWIVDVTTIGATIIYGFVSAGSIKLSRLRGDKTEQITGMIGLCIMIGFAAYILLPNFIAEGSMAKETYFLFIAWSILGFLFFHNILQRDRAKRFGKTIIVWIALLALVLFVALIWMRQSMIASNQLMIDHVREYYMNSGDVLSQMRTADEEFIEKQVLELRSANTKTILMATGMFLFSLFIMLTNYSFMNKRTKESEMIANRDAMTGVKSKHAYLMREKEIDAEISGGFAKDMAVVVCDVNGLKKVNDTLGHKAGDEYIRSACSLICDLFQHSPVFRVGGDEFVVLLTGHDLQECDRLMAELHNTSIENIGTGRVVVAGGAARYIPQEDRRLEDVFERADALMYKEKQELKAMGAPAR